MEMDVDQIKRPKFPGIATIQTLSNTRLDRLEKVECLCISPKTKTLTKANEEEAINVTDLHAVSPIRNSCKLLRDLAIRDNYNYNLADEEDPELDHFSTAKDSSDPRYDYETYMFHVASACRVETEPACREYKNFGEDLDLEDESVNYGSGSDPGQVILASRYKDWGLELLNLLDSVVVQVCENPSDAILSGFRENGGAFLFGPIIEVVTPKLKTPLFFLTETMNCTNLTCGWARCYTSQMVDPWGKLALTLTNAELGANCCSACFGTKEFRVNFPTGLLLGSIRPTRGTHWNPGFHLLDSEERKVFHTAGPKCSLCLQNGNKLSTILSVLCCCFSCLIEDDVFYFLEKEQQVAEIRRIKRDEKKKMKAEDAKNSGESSEGEGIKGIKRQENECLNGSGSKGYQIQVDFDPTSRLHFTKKALILTAAFIIDFLYWQSSSLQDEIEI